MGLEEHLLSMFRDDFEFNDSARALRTSRPSTGGARATRRPRKTEPAAATSPLPPGEGDTAVLEARRRGGAGARWTPDAEKELGQDPPSSSAARRAAIPNASRMSAGWSP